MSLDTFIINGILTGKSDVYYWVEDKDKPYLKHWVFLKNKTKDSEKNKKHQKILSFIKEKAKEAIALNDTKSFVRYCKRKGLDIMYNVSTRCTTSWHCTEV